METRLAFHEALKKKRRPQRDINGRGIEHEKKPVRKVRHVFFLFCFFVLSLFSLTNRPTSFRLTPKTSKPNTRPQHRRWHIRALFFAIGGAHSLQRLRSRLTRNSSIGFCDSTHRAHTLFSRHQRSKRPGSQRPSLYRRPSADECDGVWVYGAVVQETGGSVP